MNRKNRLLVFVSLALLVIVMVPNAFAYFSTYTETKGMKKINLKDESHIEEKKVENGIKEIVITADENSEPVFIRVKAIHVNTITTSKSNTADTDTPAYNPSDWTKNGDYYYYKNPIDGSDDTTGILNSAKLNLKVEIPSTDADKIGDQVHVVVVYEAIPANGSVNNPDLWNNTSIVAGGNS